MNHTMLNAGSAMNQCARFIAHSVFSLRAQAFTQQISSYQHLWIKCADHLTKRSRHADHLLKLDRPSTLLARALQGLKPRLKGVARKVAKVLLGALCLSGTQPAEAQLDATKSIKSLAAYQLTDAQYLCHNSIIYIESRWKIDAIGNKSGNKQTHGYYQMKSKAALNAPYDKQFELYWYYVAKRYGVTKYDEPNYCAALKHLRTRGWQ
jgi:hypothetical protein